MYEVTEPKSNNTFSFFPCDDLTMKMLMRTFGSVPRVYIVLTIEYLSAGKTG